VGSVKFDLGCNAARFPMASQKRTPQMTEGNGAEEDKRGLIEIGHRAGMQVKGLSQVMGLAVSPK